MKWLGLAILIVCVGLNNAETRDADGKIRANVALGIKFWYNPTEIKSMNYPSYAPHDLIQTWKFVAFGGNQYPKQGFEAHLFRHLHSRGITDGVLAWEDGKLKREWRGEVRPFSLISSTNYINLILTTGKEEGARVSCNIQAIYLDGKKNEVTTTTTTPKPAKNSFRFVPSEEVDSSEHGGEAGDKTTSCQCGWANKFGSRIVNGTETNRNEFPFAAALIERDTRWRFCGSTIITEYHAITAAHCTERPLRDKIPLAIIVGIHNLNDEIKPPTEIIEVERAFQHQEYAGAPTYKHDLTLLILKTKITFGPHVGPACLPTHQVKLDRQYIKIIGWGGLYWKGPQSEYLRKVNVRVVPMDECNYEYGGVDQVNPTQICTFAKHRASCQGDSGGPVIWLDPDTNRYTLVGAVSFGAACGRKPTVHTAIGHYLDWIEHHVRVYKGGKICQKVE